MILSALGVAYSLKAASGSSHPEHNFVPFLILFLMLFITTGIGNGSTYRMIPIFFEPKHAGSVLGWTAAVAAYCVHSSFPRYSVVNSRLGVWCTKRKPCKRDSAGLFSFLT